MLILRATKKVLKLLPESSLEGESSDTALGDWYVNRIVVDRKPLLLLVSEKSRLAILEPARDVKKLPAALPTLVGRRLRTLGVPERQVAQEIWAMHPVAIKPTKDRSVLGQVVDFSRAIPYYLPVGDWGEEELRLSEEQLGDTPCLCSAKGNQTVWPVDETVTRLKAKWG